MPAHTLVLPTQGRRRQDVLAELETARDHDVNWQGGKVFSLVFHAGEEVSLLSQEAYRLYFAENALNPGAFPSLRRFETEVIAMTANLLGGDREVVGNMTSGGTESILMAVLTAREWARTHRPDIKRPTVILPVTAHPAFAKAGHYFDLKLVHTPVRSDFRADMTAMAAAMDDETVMLVGSAPSYPQGVVDPISEIAGLAASHGVLCHVDACVGGLMLPFVRRLGYRVPAFDFSVPGVTSISADLHKYGYTAKGASVILYRGRGLRRLQLFASTDWPGGIYASPTMAGTRPGGAIASAWAVMVHLGEEGYKGIAERVMQATMQLRQGIQALPDVHVLGDPEMSVLAIASDTLDIYRIGDEMSLRGWHMDRQQFPASLHLTVNQAHCQMVASFLTDLQEAVEAVKRPSLPGLQVGISNTLIRWITRLLPEKWLSWLFGFASRFLGGGQLPRRSAALYGMMGSLPNRGDLRQLVLDLLESFTDPAQVERKP